MLYIAVILIATALLTGFVFVLHYEEQHGMRFFAPKRSELDSFIERLQFIVHHVDLAAFLQEEIHRAGTIAGHAIVTVSLQAVRSVERVLTRLVRYLRTRNDTLSAPRESSREFVRTLSDFKDTLKTSYSASDIESN